MPIVWEGSRGKGEETIQCRVALPVCCAKKRGVHIGRGGGKRMLFFFFFCPGSSSKVQERSNECLSESKRITVERRSDDKELG
jgi:hypothetical protein